MLPEFTEQGLLPAGDYVMSLDQLRHSILVKATSRRSPTWDEQWRLQLVQNLSVLCHQLWSVGIDQIFVDGSFVEEKDHPNDIDGYFECAADSFISGKLERDLNLLDPHKIWTWDPASRRPYRGYPKRQLPMWHQYRVELYAHFGQPSGIQDEFGHPLEFPAAFRRTRFGNHPKGIIKIGGAQ